MKRVAPILLALMFVVGCRPQASTPMSGGLNTVESVDSRQVIYEGAPWVEITISQRLDPKAPAYVVGIRYDSKWANRLRWSLFEQTISAQKVVSRFRLQPIGQTNKITLTRDDFEWYPRVSGFQAVEVAVKTNEGATGQR